MEFSFFFNAILRRLPMLVMALSGIVIALVRWKRHAKVSLLTLLGLGLYLFTAVVSTILFYFASTLFGQLGSSPSNSQRLYTSLYVVQDFLHATMIILLVTAALSQRNAANGIN